MHALPRRVLDPGLALQGHDGVGEAAIFPRHDDVLHEKRQVDQEQHRRRVLKEADERDVRVDDRQPYG